MREKKQPITLIAHNEHVENVAREIILHGLLVAALLTILVMVIQ